VGNDSQAGGAESVASNPVLVEPDLEFIRNLQRSGGRDLKKCFQCGTCSAACDLSPDVGTFPRKEMARAAWGLKERLLADPNVWLCHACDECTRRCPRDARPGDVLAAIRLQCITEYAPLRFLGGMVARPWHLPLLLGIPAALLALIMAVKDPLAGFFGLAREADAKIVFSFTNHLPHWLLNSFFFLVTVFVVTVSWVAVRRFWGALRAAADPGVYALERGEAWRSLPATARRILFHRDFARCAQEVPRTYAHALVFYGFVALTLTTLWVITIHINPLAGGDLRYPMGLWEPMKVLANLGGAAVAIGCIWMAIERLRPGRKASVGSYGDWYLIGLILAVVVTGFITEVQHFQRLEPHRLLAYFVHLVTVTALLLYLPYSKLMHVVFRSTVMLFEEHYRREGEEVSKNA